MRVYPMERGCEVTSGQGWRWGQMHWGADFGRDGGSGGLPVYAVQGGSVIMVGPAQGFGSWVVVDHPTEDGGGTSVYGHIIPEVSLGQRVEAGQRIARIFPYKSPANGNVDPHVHLEVHRYGYAAPGPNRLDPVAWLAGAGYPGEQPQQPVDPAPAPGGFLSGLSPEAQATVVRGFAQWAEPHRTTGGPA
jgi:murein DD-endopeptidase MepM/ murein hydrolase activator NlpD